MAEEIGGGESVASECNQHTNNLPPWDSRKRTATLLILVIRAGRTLHLQPVNFPHQCGLLPQQVWNSVWNTSYCLHHHHKGVATTLRPMSPTREQTTGVEMRGMGERDRQTEQAQNAPSGLGSGKVLPPIFWCATKAADALSQCGHV